MRLDKIDDQSIQSNERKSAHDDNPPRLLTPARRLTRWSANSSTYCRHASDKA